MLGDHPPLSNTIVDPRLVSDGDPPTVLAPSLVEPPPPEGRYAIVQVLGEGAAGWVLEATDHDLARQVALKVGRGTAAGSAQVLHEARVAAALDHPNIAPVFDVGRASDGAVWFSMKRVLGISLGRALEQVAAGAPPPAVATLNDRLTVLRKVCDAVAAAHHSGYLHRDIKPDNIMLGPFGEVLLVDWGIALNLAEGQVPSSVSGTPAFMSPEQARNEPLGVESDIYALGATLFMVLIGRPPLRLDHEGDYWERKRAGEIDQPTAGELTGVPRQLLAIASAALQPDRDERYAAVGELADDLARYQAGQAVSVWRDPWRTRCARAWARHRRRFVISSVVVGIILAVLGYLYGEALKDIATWGRPIVSEDFRDEGWRQRWAVAEGGFAVIGDHVVSTGQAANILVLRDGVTLPAAIEYEGWFAPEAQPGDLSVIWYPTMAFASDGSAVAPPDGLRLQLGAYDNSFSAVVRDGQRMVRDPFRLEAGRRYRIRVEVSEDRFVVRADGVVVLDHREAFPVGRGWFALYGYYAGKSFADVRVYSLGVPLRLPAIALGDAFAREAQWTQAAHEYARVADGHPGSAIADDARYREGLCRERAGDTAGATIAWNRLRGGAEDGRLHLQLARRASERGDHSAVLARLESAGISAIAHDAAARQWTRSAEAFARSGGDPATMGLYLDLRDRRFAEVRSTAAAAADLLIAAGRAAEVPGRFPDQRTANAEALIRLGRGPEVLSAYRDQYLEYVRAAIETARYDLLTNDPGTSAWATRWARLETGPHVLDQFVGDRQLEALVRIELGRAEEVLRDYADVPEMAGMALVALGRDAEAERVATGWARAVALIRLGRAQEWPSEQWCRDALGLEAYIAGRDEAAYAAFTPSTAASYLFGSHFAVRQFLLVPLLRDLRAGGHAHLRSACAAIVRDRRWCFSQTLWHDASLVLGEIDVVGHLGQPCRRGARGRCDFAQALRAELDGNVPAAVVAYRRWLVEPNQLDPVLVRFARWRLEQISGW